MDFIYYVSGYYAGGRISAAPLLMKPSRWSETRVGGYLDTVTKIKYEGTTCRLLGKNIVKAPWRMLRHMPALNTFSSRHLCSILETNRKYYKQSDVT